MGGEEAGHQELEEVGAFLLVVQQDGRRKPGFEMGAGDWREGGGREK